MRFWGHDRQVYLMIFPNKGKMGGDACIFNAMQRTADPKVIRVLQSSWTITFVKIKRHISKFHGVWESPKCIIWIFTSKQYLYGLCRKNYFLLDLHTVILHLSVKRIPKILCGSISWNSVSVFLLSVGLFLSSSSSHLPPREMQFSLWWMSLRRRHFSHPAPLLMTLASLVASHQKLLKKMVILNP